MKRVIRAASSNTPSYEDYIAVINQEGIDTTEHKYRIVYCEDLGFGRYDAPEAVSATFPGDWLAGYFLGRTYSVPYVAPLLPSEMEEMWVESCDEDMDYFRKYVDRYKNYSGNDFVEEFGDAGKDFIVKAINLDTGKVIIDGTEWYNELI